MLARVSLAARVAAPWRRRRWYHSEHEEILPMEIRYDEETEFPRLCDVNRMDHMSSLYIPNSRDLLHRNIDRYIVRNVLREIYVHVKNKGKAASAARTEVNLLDYRNIVKTLQRFGSIYMYKVGTCVKRYRHLGDDDRMSVVVDKGLWKTIDKNIAEFRPPSFAWSTPRFSMQWVKPTGFVMWSVPRLLLVHDAFRVRGGLMDFCHPKLRRELLLQGMCIDKAEEIVESMGFKAAVEIERSLIKKGNLVFFMQAQDAANKDKVLAELGKQTGIDTAAFTLAPHPSYDNPSNVFCFRLEDNRNRGFPRRWW